MKKLVFFAAAALFATPVLAQAPSFQQGSGQSAGGPANELNTSGPPMKGVNEPNRAVVPPAGKGQTAGGPANEMNSPTGGPATTGTINEPNRAISPPAGKGQSSGGPLGEELRKQ